MQTTEKTHAICAGKDLFPTPNRPDQQSTQIIREQNP